MSFFMGLSLLISFCFAVHVLSTGGEFHWLLILFFIPFLGSLAYYLLVYRAQSGR